MRDLGLLRWQTRLVRADWRAEQTSNAYELVPTAALPCGGQSGRETRRVGISYCQPPRLDDAAARENAVRQLRLLGFPVPAAWQEGRLLMNKGDRAVPAF
jgi:hypothetical protein